MASILLCLPCSVRINLRCNGTWLSLFPLVQRVHAGFSGDAIGDRSNYSEIDEDKLGNVFDLKVLGGEAAGADDILSICGGEAAAATVVDILNIRAAVLANFLMLKRSLLKFRGI